MYNQPLTSTDLHLLEELSVDSNVWKELPLWGYKEQLRELETYHDLQHLPCLQQKGQTLSTRHEFKSC